MDAVVVLSILLGMCVLCWLEGGKGCFCLFVCFQGEDES